MKFCLTARSEDLTAVLMNIFQVFRNITSSGLRNSYRRFGALAAHMQFMSSTLLLNYPDPECGGGKLLQNASINLPIDKTPYPRIF